jgi:hypothetical protein
VIGCTFGYSDEPIETLEPDAIISHYSELDAAVRNLLASRASPAASKA